MNVTKSINDFLDSKKAAPEKAAFFILWNFSNLISKNLMGIFAKRIFVKFRQKIYVF